MLSTHHLFSTSDRRFPATYGSDVAFERGCTEVSDENLYKCQTVEDSHGGKGLLQMIWKRWQCANKRKETRCTSATATEARAIRTGPAPVEKINPHRALLTTPSSEKYILSSLSTTFFGGGKENRARASSLWYCSMIYLCLCTYIRNFKAKELFTNQVLLLRLEGEQVFRVRVWLKDRLSRQHRVQNCQEERPWRPDVCQRLRHWGGLLLWHLW